MEQRIKGTTGLLALIGSPVGHSGSPAMYNFSFQYHNLDYAYMAFDIKEDQVPAALDAMRLFKMRGCNVTMPCKNEVAKHMDELSPAARIIGAVNTIVNEDGKLIGHITDGIASADILVNGTLAGMKPHDDISLITDKSVFRPDLVVADVVYNPAETKLIREAKEAGVKKAIGGKGMLLWQGAAAYKLYTGLEMPTDEYQKFQEENASK